MKLALALLLLSGALVGNCQPDMILYNGKVFTSKKSSLWAEAVAIKGERITAVGTNDVVLKLKDRHTRLIDLQGHVAVPGFNDAHAHLGAAFPGREISLWREPSQDTPWEVVRDSVWKAAREVPPGTWITATVDPDLFDDERARKAVLDSIAPEHPVMLGGWTGHGKLLNTPALTLTGITAKSVSPGGWLRKNESGGLTGYAEEYGGFMIHSILSSKLKTEKIIDELKALHHYTASLGITTMQNISTAFHPQQAQDVYAFPHFSCRTRLIAFPVPRQNQLQLNEWLPVFREFNKMNYGSGMKMILDGTPIERLACMREPYSDRNTFGKLNFSVNEVKDFMRFALENRQQILIHAVGDSTISTIIRAMRALHPDAFWRDKRLRLEHAEMAVVQKEDLQTLKSLGIVIVQNPLHLAVPKIINQRLDTTRTKYFQAMRSLLDNDIPFALGSDGPPNPFLGLMFTTLHPDNPREAITREEAVIAYTHGSAYAEFSEGEKGTIEPGKLADIAVLSQDIFEIPVSALPATQSILTLIGGEIVHDGKEL